MGVDFLFDWFHFSHHCCNGLVSWAQKNVIVSKIIRQLLYFFRCFRFRVLVDDKTNTLIWLCLSTAAAAVWSAKTERHNHHRLYIIRAKIPTNWNFSQWIYKSGYCWWIVRSLYADSWSVDCVYSLFSSSLFSPVYFVEIRNLMTIGWRWMDSIWANCAHSIRLFVAFFVDWINGSFQTGCG